MIPVSLLSSYLYCPRRIVMERVLEIRAPPGPPMVSGSIKHQTFDLINKTEQEIVTAIRSFMPFNDIFSLYRKNYYKILSDTILEFKPKIKELGLEPLELFHKFWNNIYLYEARTRSSNVFDFIKKNKVFGQELWEKLMPKYLTEYSIRSENLQLTGIIDKVEINNNSYTPIELKSGTAPKTGVWPGNKIQLTAYILMLKEKFSNSNEGYIYYTDSGDRRKVVINPFSEQELIKARDSVTSLLSSKNLPEICKNKNKCTNCQLKEQCYKL